MGARASGAHREDDGGVLGVGLRAEKADDEVERPVRMGTPVSSELRSRVPDS